MKTRIITGLVLIPLLVIVLLSNIHIIAAAVTIVSVLGLSEFFKATDLKKHKGLCLLGYMAAVVFCLRTYISVGVYMLLFYVGMVTVFVLMLKNHKTLSVTDGGLMIFGTIYIPLLLSTLIDIGGLQYGKFLLWIVFIGAFATDTFAYFTGVFFGKHKLCPEISPKKTIEGSIGGTVGCIVLLLLYGLLLDKVFEMDINYVKLTILGVIASPVSQIGDLTASIIKRKFGVKDYGNLFPGHGGILDRLDSVIAVAPLVYIYLNMVGI